MPESQAEAEIIKAYALAQKFAPSIIKKFNLQGQVDEDDAVGEFIKNFIDKGFLDKFDPKVQSFDRYVYMGLRNSAIQAARKRKERTSIDVGKDDEGGLAAILPANAPQSREYVEELIDDVEDFKFGYGKTAVLTSTPTDPSDEPEVIAELPSTGHSVMKMISMGYKPMEIAQHFGVSRGTISGALDKIRIQLMDLYPARFVESIFHIDGDHLFDHVIEYLL